MRRRMARSLVEYQALARRGGRLLAGSPWYWSVGCAAASMSAFGAAKSMGDVGSWGKGEWSPGDGTLNGFVRESRDERHSSRRENEPWGGGEPVGSNFFPRSSEGAPWMGEGNQSSLEAPVSLTGALPLYMTGRSASVAPRLTIGMTACPPWRA